MSAKGRPGQAKVSQASAGDHKQKRAKQQPVDDGDEDHSDHDFDKQQHNDDDSDDYNEDSGTEEDDTDDDDASDTSDDGSDAEEINVTFEFHDPHPIDFKSIRRLLEHFLPGNEDTFPVSDLSDAILNQAEVGTTVKVEDDVDVYAFATVLPLSQYAAEPWFTHVRKFLLGKVPNDQIRANLRKQLGGKPIRPEEGEEEAGAEGKGEAGFATGTGNAPAPSSSSAAAAVAAPAVTLPAEGLGLLLNERVVNMPPELAPSILSNLRDDVKWASSSSKVTAADRARFASLSHLLMIAPCWIERGAKDSDTSINSGAKVQYYHWEDGHFEKHAVLKFDFAVSGTGGKNAGPDAAPVGATASAPSSSSAGAGKKRRAPTKAADDDDEDDEEGGAGSGSGSRISLRAPQLRRVMIVPISALNAVATSTAAQAEQAREEEERVRKEQVKKLLSSSSSASSSGGTGTAQGTTASSAASHSRTGTGMKGGMKGSGKAAGGGSSSQGKGRK